MAGGAPSDSAGELEQTTSDLGFVGELAVRSRCSARGDANRAGELCAVRLVVLRGDAKAEDSDPNSGGGASDRDEDDAVGTTRACLE
jgi:hypothetical protein